MVQFSTLSLSLPPIHDILRATFPSSEGSSMHVFLVLDYHHLPPPPPLPRPDSSRESMIRYSHGSWMQLLYHGRD